MAFMLQMMVVAYYFNKFCKESPHNLGTHWPWHMTSLSNIDIGSSGHSGTPILVLPAEHSVAVVFTLSLVETFKISYWPVYLRLRSCKGSWSLYGHIFLVVISDHTGCVDKCLKLLYKESYCTQGNFCMKVIFL